MRPRHLLGVYGWLFLIFLDAPIVPVMVYSVNATAVNMMIWNGFTLDGYRLIFGRPATVRETATDIDSTEQLFTAIWTSVRVALSASVIAPLFGTAVALAVARFRFQLAGFSRTVLLVPMVMPDIVPGIAPLIFVISIGVTLSAGTMVIGRRTFPDLRGFRHRFGPARRAGHHV